MRTNNLFETELDSLRVAVEDELVDVRAELWNQLRRAGVDGLPGTNDGQALNNRLHVLGNLRVALLAAKAELFR